MRFAVSLSLAAIGVSFLLPSDGYKAALFIACAALAFLVMEEEEPELAGISGAPENDEFSGAPDNEDVYEEYQDNRGGEHPFSRH
ncbi:hypothetical protein CN203_23700 [Sinorhizobium meliloti]|uniref:hypothetical protein n=1 Tax=Rhizobium meliloti TaxID=382 RepID=UPI000FD84C48|nr:hypothetical protein [Sinorhizobium meliloti]RVH74286.1 hypothetical protein CN203_23700 [Sinorhizobium meliloti]